MFLLQKPFLNSDLEFKKLGAIELLTYYSLSVNPTKMCIKYSPYLHQKIANLAINIFFSSRCFVFDVAYYFRPK
jgi:hypothetical protein